MTVKNPKSFWINISKKENWRDYILPRKKDEDFDYEGFLEAERLFYFFDKSQAVVDYGCGVGRVAKYVAPRTKNFIGIDINTGFVEKARRYVKSKNARFYTLDDFKEKAIADFVYSLMVLQHNDDKNRKNIMNNIYDRVKSNYSDLKC